MKQKIFNRNYIIKRSVKLLKCYNSKRHYKCNDEFCSYCNKELKEQKKNEIFDYCKNTNNLLWAVTILDPNYEIEKLFEYHSIEGIRGIYLNECVFKTKTNLNWYSGKIINHYHGIIFSNEKPNLKKYFPYNRQVYVTQIWDLSGWINYMVKMNIDISDKKQLRWLDSLRNANNILKF